MIIKNVFDDDCGERIYGLFMDSYICLLKQSWLWRKQVTDTVTELQKLKTNLEEKQDNKFIPRRSQKAVQGTTVK
jgi:hypothetical protein